ncbi:MAG: hypothetical protein ACR2ML_14950 [Solirubrobacteraceae bacterium]
MNGAVAMRRHWGQSASRALGLSALAAAAAVFLAYLVTEVPVVSPPLGGGVLSFYRPDGSVEVIGPIFSPLLPRGYITQYWTMALAGAAIVLSVDALAVAAAFFGRSRQRSAELESRPPEQPSPLRLERVPVRVAVISGAASLTLFVVLLAQGHALWVPVLFALLPWMPLLAVEAIWKYEHYGLWSIFGVITLLQIGHMGEHTTQVTQLLLNDGALANSHGVFGQLDFETVHFVWDSLIWLSLGVLLYRFSRGNRWLWVAFAASSLHQVEHFYLFWLYNEDRFLYIHGGWAGIMGSGGLIGSPLDRPYLHFTYNLLVTVPMALAFWDQTKRVYDRRRVSPRPIVDPAPATD